MSLKFLFPLKEFEQAGPHSEGAGCICALQPAWNLVAMTNGQIGMGGIYWFMESLRPNVSRTDLFLWVAKWRSGLLEMPEKNMATDLNILSPSVLIGDTSELLPSQQPHVEGWLNLQEGSGKWKQVREVKTTAYKEDAFPNLTQGCPTESELNILLKVNFKNIICK